MSRCAVFGGFVDCPIFDVDETVSCVDKAVIFGESADVFVEIIDKAGLVNTDGRNVVDPAVEEGLVFLDAGRFIHGSAGAKNEVIDESVGVIGEVETSGGGLRRVIVGEKIRIGAELDFVEQDVVITLADDVDEKLLTRVGDV